MANITYRTTSSPTIPGTSVVKGAPLTLAEVDANFKAIDEILYAKAGTASQTFVGLSANGPSGFSVGLTVPGTAQGQSSGLSFKATLNGSSGDNVPKRTADIVVGRVADYGSEFMTLGVGGYSNNDAEGISKAVLRLSNQINSVNYIELIGATSTNGPIINPFGSDTNISLDIRSKGTGTLTFRNSINTALVLSQGTNPVNYLEITSSGATYPVAISPKGSDTNISIGLYSKGTGNTQFFTNNSLNVMIGGVSGATRYISMLGSVSGNPMISASAGKLEFPSAVLFSGSTTFSGSVDYASTLTTVGIISSGTVFSNGNQLANIPISSLASGQRGLVTSSHASGGAAVMTFSRVGVGAQYLGIDTDNKLKFGGNDSANVYDVTLNRVVVINTSTTAVPFTTYILTGNLVLTLPSSPNPGDKVSFSNVSDLTTCVLGRNGQKIMGLAEDMNINSKVAYITMMYVDSTRGWVIA